MAHQIPDWLLLALALPIYQLWHVVKYANTREGWPAKIGMFVTFVPATVLCGAIWGTPWMLILHAIWQAAS